MTKEVKCLVASFLLILTLFCIRDMQNKREYHDCYYALEPKVRNSIFLRNTPNPCKHLK